MQAVAGENLMFLDTTIGYTDSMHDARVLRSNELLRKAENGDILNEPEGTAILQKQRRWLLVRSYS